MKQKSGRKSSTDVRSGRRNTLDFIAYEATIRCTFPGMNGEKIETYKRPEIYHLIALNRHQISRVFVLLVAMASGLLVAAVRNELVSEKRNGLELS